MGPMPPSRETGGQQRVTIFAGPPVDDVDGIGALTLGGLLDEVAARFAGNEAVVFDDPLRDGATVRLTYADLRTETRTDRPGADGRGRRARRRGRAS